MPHLPVAVHCYMDPYKGPIAETLLATIHGSPANDIWSTCSRTCLENLDCVAIHMTVYNATVPPEFCGGQAPCDACVMTTEWFPGHEKYAGAGECAPPACRQAVKSRECWRQYPSPLPPGLPPPTPPPPTQPGPSVLMQWHVPWAVAAVAALLACIVLLLLCRNKRRLRALRAEIDNLRRLLSQLTFASRGRSPRFDPARQTMHADALTEVMAMSSTPPTTSPSMAHGTTTQPLMAEHGGSPVERRAGWRSRRPRTLTEVTDASRPMGGEAPSGPMFRHGDSGDTVASEATTTEAELQVARPQAVCRRDDRGGATVGLPPRVDDDVTPNPA